MVAKWFEEYRRNSQKTLFLSKLGAFLVSLFSILSLYNIARIFYIENYELQRVFEIHLLFTAVLFQSAIFLVYAVKFGSLFFKAKKSFVFNQWLWVIGLLFLILYWYISIPEPNPFVLSGGRTEIFRHSNPIFNAIGIYYLILSPIHRIITAVISYFKSK